jgi:hypothetical protein
LSISTTAKALLVGVGAWLGGDLAAAAGEVNLSRLIAEAAESDKGVVQPINHALVQALCRDEDGCELIVQMIDQQPGKLGNVHSRTWRLFLSATSGLWKLSDDTEGTDGSSVQYKLFENCIFGDAETYTGGENGMSDSGAGFGLLNVAGPAAVSPVDCRVVMID